MEQKEKDELLKKASEIINSLRCMIVIKEDMHTSNLFASIREWNERYYKLEDYEYSIIDD